MYWVANFNAHISDFIYMMHLNKSLCSALVQVSSFCPKPTISEQKKKPFLSSYLHSVNGVISAKKVLAHHWQIHGRLTPFLSNHSHACLGFLSPLLFVSFSLSPPVLRHSRKCCWRSLACGSGQAASTGQKFPVSTGSHGGGEPLPIHGGRQWEKYTSRLLKFPPQHYLIKPHESLHVSAVDCCVQKVMQFTNKKINIFLKRTTGEGEMNLWIYVLE